MSNGNTSKTKSRLSAFRGGESVRRGRHFSQRQHVKDFTVEAPQVIRFARQAWHTTSTTPSITLIAITIPPVRRGGRSSFCLFVDFFLSSERAKSRGLCSLSFRELAYTVCQFLLWVYYCVIVPVDNFVSSSLDSPRVTTRGISNDRRADRLCLCLGSLASSPIEPGPRLAIAPTAVSRRRTPRAGMLIIL